MTKLRELHKCDTCGRAVRDWRHVIVSQDALLVHDLKVCRPCATFLIDAWNELCKMPAPSSPRR